ncbi:MAG TPA: DedA family protein [Gammaproteobacteria bacterium]|nr:DedA family protein [Gammaproteobacteria bacterium]
MIVPAAWPLYISHYGYAAIFLLSLVEGPLVTLFAGFLASQGLLAVLAVYLIVVLGDLTGDMAYYAAGRWVLRRLPWRFARKGTKLERYAETLRTHIRSRPGRVLLFGKFTHSIGLAVQLSAGASRLPLNKFIAYNLFGTLPKSAALVVGGYFFGRFYQSFQGEGRWVVLLGFTAVAFAILYLMRLFRRAADDQKGAE